MSNKVDSTTWKAKSYRGKVQLDQASLSESDSVSDPREYGSFTCKFLRKELKKRGLQTGGRKGELVSRLRDSDNAMNDNASLRERRNHEPNASSINGDTKNKAPDHAVDNGRAKVGRDLSLVHTMSLQKERASIVLWKKPLTTLYYFLLELLVLLQNYGVRMWHNKKLVAALLLTFLVFFTAYHMDGPHQPYVLGFRKELLWCTYWIGLGVLSSVGLGTGLHTFLLYLGPHIAAVTLAAFECMSVDFPTPPYPDDIVCPEEEGTSMSLWTIMSKVRVEAFMWGAGTAIGELPPYFMARAARLSGQIDEEEQEIEELVHEKQMHPSELSFLDRAKVAVHDLVQRVGFIGILLCASIPNPLFDLAGITCGHFLVPFWTFFGATLIGKAIIKMHIQKLFVIFVFSEHHVEQVVSMIKYIPHFGKSLQTPFKEYLQKQKTKLHHKPGSALPGDSSWLSWVFEKIVMAMVVYFIISIIHSMAQSYHKRMTQQSRLRAKETKD